MLKKVMLGIAVGVLCAGISKAGPDAVSWTSGTTIEVGTWYKGSGVLAAAKARAEELGVPLLALWTHKGCGHCAAFESALDGDAFVSYLANRGLVMVYGMDDSSIKSWVGSGEYPLWRVTWTKGEVDHKGQYPKTYVGFRSELENQIAAYVYDPSVSPDPSKDAYDPASDTAASAPTLAWSRSSTATTQSCLLSSGTNNYTDLSDWYKFTVVKGTTYIVSFSNVVGQTNDTVWAAIYGDAAGTSVLGGPTPLAASSFEFFAASDSTIYVKVWRLTSHDATIKYSMTYQQVALGTLSAAVYQGWVGDINEDGVLGTVSLTVTSSGRVSGKAVFPNQGVPYAGTYSLASSSYDMLSNDTAWVSGSFSKSGTTLPFVAGIDVNNGRVVGTLGSDSNAVPIELYRNDWSKSAMAEVAATFSGYYTVTFPNCCARWPDDAPAGSGYAGITLDKKGGFKIAGKLGDGTAFSQSGVLFLHPETTVTNPVLCALLYAAPTAYKGGLFGGIICFGDSNTNGVIDVNMGYGDKLIWSSLNPFSVPSYDAENPGFVSWLSAVGGWYNKLENLATYYAGKTLYVDDLAQPPDLSYTFKLMDSDGTSTSTETAEASSWQATASNLVVSVKANGSGFTVPSADLKLLGKDDDGTPNYNYDSGVNPNGLTLSFNRTTGLMSGTFKVYYDYVVTQDSRGDTDKLTWKHTQKNASYAAALLLEQADPDSDMASDGYYLIQDSAMYETSSGADRSYTLKRSYEFTTRAGMIEE